MEFNTERSRVFSLYFILLMLAVIGICIYGMHFIYGFSLYPDEFGYWSGAAAAAGYDWSRITGLGYYYSFGYALILTPIMVLTGGGVAAYRAAVAVNAVLKCVSVWLLYDTLRYIYPNKNRYVRLLGTTAGVLYPVGIYYMQLTMVESVLAFMYILVCNMAARYLTAPKTARLIPLLLSLTYMYYLHMRTISVFIAGLIILVIHAINTCRVAEDRAGRRSSRAGGYVMASAIILYAVAAFGIGEYIKGIVMETAYAHSSARQLGMNDYSGQIGRLSVLLDIRNYVGILRSLSAKLMYLGMSSFGMVYVAVISLIGRIYIFLTGKSRAADRMLPPAERTAGADHGRSRGYISAFILLTALAQTGMIAVTSGSGSEGRLDTLAYGRYTEHVSPVLIAVGVCVLSDMAHRYRWALVSFVYNAIATLITVGWTVNNPSRNMHSFCIAGISYLWERWDMDIVTKYLISLAVSALTMAVMYICVLLMTDISGVSIGKSPYGAERTMRHNAPAVICAFLITAVMEIILGMHLSHMYVYPSSEADKLDGRIVRYIESDLEGVGYKDIRVIYLSEGNPPYIDIVQFGLRDISIDVLRARSRATEAGDEEYPVPIRWEYDDADGDYDGSAEMLRLTDESVLSILRSYEGSDRLYIISDIDSVYEDILSGQYRCVMDTMWMKLYVTE